MHTLVYHAGALGDFLTILPALEVWRQADPGGVITLLGRKAFGELARENGLVDEIWDVERSDAACLFAAGVLPPEIVCRLNGFAAALVFACPDSPLCGHLQQAGIGSIRRQDPFPAERTPIGDYRLALVGDLLAGNENEFRLTPSPVSALGTMALVPDPGRTVFLHAGSGSPRKNWPFERFYALAALLKAAGMATAWLHGPAEPEQPYPPGDQVLREVSLSVLVHLFARGRLFVGNDSGLTHLAAACGCSAVVLFGPSDPQVWAPAGRRVTIRAGSPSCAPCHPHGGPELARCGRHCLTDIPVETVYGACLERLGMVERGRNCA